MTCAEFQRVLPYIIDTGGNAEQEQHLRECPVCSDLVQDLKYIADQAKLLVPMEDPSPRVWDGLQKSLEREGLVKAAPARRPLLGPPASSWGWVLAVGGVVVLSVTLLIMRSSAPESISTSQMGAASPAQVEVDAEDQQLLQAVSTLPPDVRATYEQGLKDVNAYISDAKRAMEQDPTDGDAQQFLLQAYGQRAMLYQMAARTGE
jgi:hypothetical protein